MGRLQKLAQSLEVFRDQLEAEASGSLHIPEKEPERGPDDELPRGM